MLAGGVLAEIQLPEKKDGPDKKCDFWVKIGSVWKIWTFKRPEASNQKISDIKGTDWRNSRDQVNPSAQEQGDLNT